MSRVAASLATRTGWRKSLSRTRVPTRRVVVASAATVTATMGAHWSSRWSGTYSVEYPRSSALRARSRQAAEDAAPDAWRAKRKAAMAGDPTALTCSGDEPRCDLPVEPRVLAQVPRRTAAAVARRRRTQEGGGATGDGATARLRRRGA